MIYPSRECVRSCWSRHARIAIAICAAGVLVCTYATLGERSTSLVVLGAFCCAVLLQLVPLLAQLCACLRTLRSSPATDSLMRVPIEHLRLMYRDGDFSPEDFEALSALDDNNVSISLGASAADVRHLPTFLFRRATEGGAARPQDDSRCVICLEDFSDGESVMALPCLHTFHTDEITTWLLARASCPVCKMSIFG